MKTTIIFFLALLLSGALSAQDFTTSKQKGIELKAYQTFTVSEGEIITDRKIDRESFFEEFKKVTIKELESRGYTFMADSTAQLSVSYVVETTRVLETENLGPLGEMPASNAGDQQTQHWSREFERATLIIDMEAGNDNSVWSAEGVMDIGRAQGISILEYSIKNAFSDFPKRSNKKKKHTKKG